MNASFQDFVKQEEKRILNVAAKLKDYEIDAHRIGIMTSKSRVVEWLANFDKVGFNDFELPLILLEHLEYFSTINIYHKIAQDARGLLALKNSYVAPLGEPNESSFKISAYQHRSPNYRLSVPTLLDDLENENDFNLIFLDDFLNSGGQLISIFMAFFGLKPVDGQINDEIEKRQKLSDRQSLTLKRARIHFFYFLAFTEGVKTARQFFQDKLGLSIEITSHLATNQNGGVFGDIEEQMNIAERVDGVITHNSAFKGMNYSKLTKFYNLLKEIGCLLLKANESDWSAEKINSRALGYGNLCSAMLTDCNVPTITLTAIWQTESIVYNGKNIRWNELLPRVKKKIQSKRSVVEGFKDDPDGLKKANKYLQQLYETDFIEAGLHEAKKAFELFPLNFDTLRHVIRFHLRCKQYVPLQSFIEGLPLSKFNDGFKTLINSAKFECKLRMLYDSQPDNMQVLGDDIAKIVTHLNDIPDAFQNFPDTLYWYGRWNLEMWINQTKKNKEYLIKANEYFERAIQAKYKWFIHCYQCITLLLLKHENCQKQIKLFFEKMAEQRLINPDRPSVRTYSITSFLLTGNSADLMIYLLEITKPSSVTDFQSTIFHHLDMIFYRRSKQKAPFKRLLDKWLNALPKK